MYEVNLDNYLKIYILQGVICQPPATVYTQACAFVVSNRLKLRFTYIFWIEALESMTLALIPVNFVIASFKGHSKVQTVSLILLDWLQIFKLLLLFQLNNLLLIPWDWSQYCCANLLLVCSCLDGPVIWWILSWLTTSALWVSLEVYYSPCAFFFMFLTWQCETVNYSETWYPSIAFPYISDMN